MKKTFVLLAVLGIFSLVLTACAGRKPEPVSYTITMDEYSYSPALLDLQVGQEVTLNLVNNGITAHEFMIGREVVMQDGLPSGYREDFFAVGGVTPQIQGGEMQMGEHESGGHAHEGTMVTLPLNGGQATIKFTVTQDMVGEWEFGCFEQDGVHYAAGMVGKLVVQ